MKDRRTVKTLSAFLPYGSTTLTDAMYSYRIPGQNASNSSAVQRSQRHIVPTKVVGVNKKIEQNFKGREGIGQG
jgi:hypothetical protein